MRNLHRNFLGELFNCFIFTSMQSLIDYINQFTTLDKPAIEALHELTEVQTFKKNEFILKEGQRCNMIWFLNTGMVRKYELHDGKEITSWIHTETDTFTSLQSYGQDIPCNESIQACEDTEVIGISKNNSQKLAKHPQFLTFSNALMEQQFILIDKHTRTLNKLDAKGKYDYLAQIAPEVIKRAKLGHIASILGITQETLSRIRR